MLGHERRVAVIHRVPNLVSPALLDVAGGTFLGRQIDWLRAGGFDSVWVETSNDSTGDAVTKWVEARHDDRGLHVSRTERLVGPREVARRGGVADTQPILAVPADLLGDGDLGSVYFTANGFGAVAFFMPPTSLIRQLSGGTVRLVRAPLRYGRPAMVRGPGWGVRVSSVEEVALLSAAVRGDLLPRGRYPLRARDRMRTASAALV